MNTRFENGLTISVFCFFQLIILSFDLTLAQNLCSNIVTYEDELVSGYGRQYSGNINYRNGQHDIRNLEIVLTFNQEIELFVNYFGVSTTSDSKTFHINRDDFTLFAYSNLKIKFDVTYRGYFRPTIQEIRLNGGRVCSNVQETRQNNIKMLNFHRNFTDNRANKFNSSCAALNRDIIVSQGRWDAVLKLKSEKSVRGIEIEFKFDQPIYLLGNSFGAVNSNDNKVFKVSNNSHYLRWDDQLELPFFIKFNELQKTPDVNEIYFNGNEICEQDQRNKRVSMTTETSHFVAFKPSIQNFEDDNDDEEDAYDESICATTDPFSIVTRIIGGANVNAADFPWHAAIFDDGQYLCGGSLITKKTILTAAHCLTKQNSNRTLDKSNLKIYLGITDLRDADEQSYYPVGEIMVHKDFNPVLYTTDIALVILSKDVVLGNFIKPICLCNRTRDISHLYNQTGRVPGWGFNHENVISDSLNYLNMPIVSHKTCLRTNHYFSNILAYGETFCAGSTNGNSVCNGDSGGGWTFVENSKYYIRGIVSISAQKRNQLLCDPYKYAVFTDVAKFLKWIRKNME